MSSKIHDIESRIAAIVTVAHTKDQVDNILNRDTLTTSNSDFYTDYKPLTYVTSYPRKKLIPYSNTTLFTKDHIYDTSPVPSKRYFRLDYIECFQRLMITPKDKRCFYEYIQGDQRKPYFDIELEFKDEDRTKAINDFDQIVTLTLHGIKTELESKNIPYSQERDCIILQSHGPNKRSVHIIINNWYFNNCSIKHTSNALAFATVVRDYVPKYLWYFTKPNEEKQSQTIDLGVYSSGKEFRLIWNTKIGKDRYLDVDPCTGLKARFHKLPDDPVDMPPDLQRLRLFEACLITMVSNCKLLPNWNTEIKPREVNKIIHINTDQRDFMIEAFNNSIFFDNYNLREDQSTSGNSIYLEPKDRNIPCPIHDRNHGSNNAVLCYSKTGNIYVRCFAEGTNNIQYIGRDDILEDDESIDEVEEDNTFGETFGGFDLRTGQLIVSDVVDTTKDNIITTTNKRVQATPIIGGVSLNNLMNIGNQDPYTPGDTLETPFIGNNGPIYNMKTTSSVSPDIIGSNDGQLIMPCETTTIASFLDGNTKYVCGNEYTVKAVYDAYNRYRCNKGFAYVINGGGVKNFGSALISLGHSIVPKRVNGERLRVVTLKRSMLPITAIMNPVEMINKIQESMKNTPVTTPATPTTPATTTTKETITTKPITIPSDDRPLDRTIDIRNFMDEYLIPDPSSTVDLDNLYLCFTRYCWEKKIKLVLFGKGRLIQYFRNYLVKDPDDVNELVIKGFKCIIDQESLDNIEKETAFKRIWLYNSTPYMIGWHNGTYDERHDMTNTPKWSKIDVNVHNDKTIKSVDSLIEMTRSFEDNLPGEIKAIRSRIQTLRYYPGNAAIAKESNNIRSILSNALIDGIIIEGSEEHILMRDRINELTQETMRAKAEAVRVNTAEKLRLEESIKDDMDRLRTEASWCIAIRSTFGSGKTVNLKPYIESFPNMRILIVLPRISLTDDYMREYRALGFEIYSDLKTSGEIRGNRVIVCYPSIGEVRGSFDLLILDEYKVLKDLQHTIVRKTKLNAKSRNRSKESWCYNALKQYVCETPRVYVADALLTNAHVLEIRRMREYSNFDKRVTVYQNLHAKHMGKKIYTVDNQKLLVNTILNHLREGKRVVVPTNSKVFAEFLYKKAMELDITISLTTSDNRATLPVQELWANKQLIIYSPTILAGNSYTEPIDVVCGYFTTASCDQADSLQMMMRCRNNNSNTYYICVEKAFGSSLVPDYISSSSEGIKEYLLKVSKDIRTKKQMEGWPEEYQLPIDMVEYDHINDTIRESDAYFDSYVNHVKQCVIKQRGFLFHMLLYMRDCGFEYTGNIYAKTEDKEAIKVIQEERKVFKKERIKADEELSMEAPDITSKEYVELDRKTIKTKEDMRIIRKHRLKMTYKVDNTPIWFIRATKNKHRQHANIRRYIDLNGVVNQTDRHEMMGKIGHDIIGNKDVPKGLGPESILNVYNYNMANYIGETDIALNNNLCWHALNILKIIGAEEFIRDIPRFNVRSEEFDAKSLYNYVCTNWNEFLKIINMKQIIYNVEQLNEVQLMEEKCKMASKITNKAFGIKFRMNEQGFSIDNMWIKNQHSLVWPYNWSLTDREELIILTPEPKIPHKITLWTADVLTRLKESTPVQSGQPVKTHMLLLS